MAPRNPSCHPETPRSHDASSPARASPDRAWLLTGYSGSVPISDIRAAPLAEGGADEVDEASGDEADPVETDGEESRDAVASEEGQAGGTDGYVEI